MRVFLSHSSHDKPAVEALAAALRGRGIDAWLDKWEIPPGGDIVASINRGLDEADAGIVVYSRRSRESRWVEAEVSYLTYARVQEGKVLIPVMVGDDAWVPPLLRPLARRGIEEVEALVDALHHRSARPPLGPAAGQGSLRQVRIALAPHGAEGVRVEVAFDGKPRASAVHDRLPLEVARGQAAFLQGLRGGLQRDAASAGREALEADLAEYGRALGRLCLPGDSGEALADLLDGAPIGTLVEIGVEAEGAALLALPYEAMRLPDGRPAALQPPALAWRRPAGLAAAARAPLAGPLKILVAVGAPEEGTTGAVVLDQERELQNILDAVEPMNRLENAEVRILEVGHPAQIAAAFGADAYHVLHLSCHGTPGALELEDEEGRAVRVAPSDLVAPLKTKGRPLPLVLLNACHGGVHDGRAASFAEALLRAGVPAVLAMQTAVSDAYATALARSFYEHLLQGEHLRPSRALAAARKALETARQQALQRGAPVGETQPEYATATLFVAGDEAPLADFGADRQPLRTRPVLAVAGPVPQLRMDDLIGRRRELRETLRALRDDAGGAAGVVLTGPGGVGKSTVAGRAMQQLHEDSWRLAVHAGRHDMAAVARALGGALAGATGPDVQRLVRALTAADTDDAVRAQAVQQALAGHRVLLVLDDFEQNLVTGGEAFRDPDVQQAVAALAAGARRGRLLVTSRHPLPGLDAWFVRVAVGPLSDAEARKLVLRLPGLKALATPELARALRLVGGHPRMLEFLDALLRGGRGRLPQVTARLGRLLGRGEAAGTAGRLDESLHAALLAGARDVFLAELLDLARGHGADAALLQVAVSGLPVSAEGLARMLAADPSQAADADVAAAGRALATLEDLSLVHRFPDGSAWVHRWTAEGLAAGDGAGHRARCVRAGRYRGWRVAHESHDLGDAVEAVRNFLAGGAFDDAVAGAHACFGALRRFAQSAAVAALASEVLETLPQEHPSFASVADEEAQAHLALGATGRALDRYRALVQYLEQRAQAEPGRADYQRDLSVLYERMGDLHRALGQGEVAREMFGQSLAIRERLARAEPEQADYQRDLSVAYERMGDLHIALGQGDAAREMVGQSLAIRERLARAEPERADYQRDLSVSYSKMGDLHVALGQGEAAGEMFGQSLAIRERLARAEPERADYQRDLSVAYNRMGDLHRALGQGEAAREMYGKSLAIAERLARAEPERADYQRDLSVSYERMGDLHRALGQGEAAREMVGKSLAIRERLARAEPERADYQRDLSVAYERMGDLHIALGQGEAAREMYGRSLAIRERLARAEPERADYQRDLSVAYNRMGDLHVALGQGEAAGEMFGRSLAIFERLARAEPERADYQRDLSVSYERMGDLHRALGQGEAAREMYGKSLAIAERLARAEPERADYQRDLSVSYNRMGDLHRALGQGEAAREMYGRSLAIRERLARAEPERADYQRDLSVAYNNMGDLHRALGQSEAARQMYEKDLAIAERLARAEPERADYQRDLIVSLVKVGTADEQPGGDHLRRAWAVLQALEASGRLDPADAGMKPALAGLLAQRGLPAD